MKKTVLLKVLALTVLLVALIAGAASAAPIPDPKFGSQATYKAGPGPIEITNGDFDEDGNLDLVTANRFEDGTPNDDGNTDNDDGDISLLLGNPDGSFDEPKPFEVSVSAIDVISADFDDDENLDLAVTDPDCASNGNGCVVILLGDGNGDFAEPKSSTSGGILPFEIVAGNFDGDNDEDLAVANTFSDNVGILKNVGNGNFAPVQTVPVGTGTFPRSLDRGDLDKDGDLDLAVANAGTSDVTILNNNGFGTFTPSAETVKVGQSPLDIVVRDINDDRKLDFATANGESGNESDNVSVRLGRGDGTFRSATGEFSSGGDTPFALVVGDFNNDRKKDIAVVNNFDDNESADAGNIGVLSGRGDGTFKAAVTFDVGDGPAGLTLGKFDRDNEFDLATANFGDDDQQTVDSVSVRLNAR